MYTEKNRIDDFTYFVDNYMSFYEKYGNSVIVIKDKEVIGVYTSEIEAINNTTMSIPLGTFIVQKCDGTEDAYTSYIASW